MPRPVQNRNGITCLGLQHRPQMMRVIRVQNHGAILYLFGLHEEADHKTANENIYGHRAGAEDRPV